MTEVFRRHIAFEPKWRAAVEGSEKSPRRLSMLASTADAVDWAGWREVLMHAEGSIDATAARALLINHDPNQIAGRLTGNAIGEDGMSVDAELMDDARMASGVRVIDAVESGALRGVSVGYTYNRADTVFDEETRTLTVNKWRLLETSLTPIPADARAHVRSLPFGDQFTASAIPAAQTKEVRVSEPIQPNPQGLPSALPINVAEVSEKARESAIQEFREIDALARSVGLDSSAFIGKSKADAQDAMLRAMAEKNKTPAPDQAAITVMRVDQADKARDAFTGSVGHSAGFRDAKANAGNPLVGRGMQDAIKGYARLMGIDASDWSRKDVAMFAVGKPEMMDERHQRAANVTSTSFPNFVFLNAISKTVSKGFEMGAEGMHFEKITRPNLVPDFRSFYVGGLSSGNLTKTLENVAFPELDKNENSYNDTVKMWGGTLSLTVQALTNDDTGAFMRMLGQAGAIANKTIDKRAFQRLLMGTSAAEATSTWTSNTTSGGTLVYTTQDLMAAARAKLGLVRAAFMNKIGMDGNPLGNPPRYLIVPITREVEAQAIVGASGPGLAAGVPQSALSTEVIASPWLELSSLTGYSTTSYYLMANPDHVTGLLLSKINGYESIQVQPYDAGAVAGMNFKLWMPFEVSLATAVNGAGTTIVPGAHQGTT